MNPALATVLAITLVAGAGGGSAAQRPPTPPLAIASLSGSDLFHFYCATCHGPMGKGDGPVARSLTRAPADLTLIAMRNGGHFPTAAIERYVSGDDESTAAHGSREMPVWGPIFRSLEPKDRLTRIRIENVVAFIESIQHR
jgi:mono/diheme cytochrome c family protein